MTKILCFDIESAGVNALKADLGFVIVFGYKWVHETDAKVITISKENLKKFNDRELLLEACKVMDEADVLVGHFASVFDRRFLNGRLLIHGLSAIPPTKMRDTCMIARSAAAYSSNRLKHLAKILNLRHQKLENNWPTAWFKVMQGDMKALKGLAEYCKGDVLALEELYLRLRPYDQNHPRLHLDGDCCGSCGGAVQRRGWAYTKERRYRRWQCKSCRKWGRDSKSS